MNKADKSKSVGMLSLRALPWMSRLAEVLTTPAVLRTVHVYTPLFSHRADSIISRLVFLPAFIVPIPRADRSVRLLKLQANCNGGSPSVTKQAACTD